MRISWFEPVGMGNYVNCFGTVISLRRRVPSPGGSRMLQTRVRTSSLANSGYPQVVFKSRERKSINKYVHRMVAELFIPNPQLLPEVNHKDGDKTNNNAANLEWISRKGNVEHAINMGLGKYGKGKSI